jgi:hypothetical protein
LRTHCLSISATDIAAVSPAIVVAYESPIECSFEAADEAAVVAPLCDALHAALYAADPTADELPIEATL